ncbi:MAG: hypothetical protein QY332_18285 [Anaerolineales bacterium]|nr:MAG: hypothetical protein QY332_18285 [Anaerolineales bacterium]
MRRITIFTFILFIMSIACGGGAPTPPPAAETSIFDSGKTAYGFFPSPPEATLESVLQMYLDFGEHADVVLLQQNPPWEEFVNGANVQSERITDVTNQYILASQNNLEIIYVVDPLNGLNRREFFGLPAGWEASFANPDVRAAFTNYTLRIVREFHPRHLGLASEINTYMDFHPEDAPHFVSLYREVYGRVKAEAPETQVFVTFQWEDLNNLFLTDPTGGTPYDTKWELVEAFEPSLDLWVISSYPFAVMENGADIPSDYYTPLLTRTDKPVAIAEGGFISRDFDPFHGDDQDQVDYLNAIHSQLGGERLAFWIYLLLSDFDMESYAKFMREQGQSDADIETLSMFGSVGLREFDGTPKSALEVWDSFRK